MNEGGAHWVTIDGNHVYLTLSGKSLNDPSLAKDEYEDEEEDYQKNYDEDDYDEDDQYVDEFDSLTTREVMNMVAREMAEAMKKRMTIRELRAEKLGIDPKLLDTLENTNPKFRKMPAEKIKSELMKWWYKKTKGNVWTITPTIEELADLYNEEKNKGKKHSLKSQMAQDIVNFEARRDPRGNLRIWSLPKDDGGGAYEVAGVNEKYHPTMAVRLRKLIEEGNYKQAEQEARDYIASYTDRTGSYASNPAIEFYLRDTAFNRGPTGATKILQRALGIKEDGKMGPATKNSLQRAESNPRKLLNDLNDSRIWYEDAAVGARPKHRSGLKDRWNKAFERAKTYLNE